MSELYEINEEFRRQLLRMERAASSQMVREYGKAWNAIHKRIVDLTTRYYTAAKAGNVNPTAWLYEMERLQQLRSIVEEEIAKFAQYARGAIQANQLEAVAMARKSAWEMMRSSLPPGVSVKFNQVPTKAFENLIGFLQDGSPLSNLLNQLPGDAAQQVADGLQNGLILGWNPTRTAGSIRMALAGNLARALRIARTETLRSFREANLQTFQANAHVLRGWRWASARNERTCAMCWAMDGTEHSFEEHMEEHICGRCSMVPITRSWKDLGFDIDEVESRIPATGAEAFAALSNTEQLQILGPAKYMAWKEGSFLFSDLVGRKYDPQWGWTRYEKSLTQIVGTVRAKEYTRLALMGVAQNAGNYSVDDLVRIAGVGLRNLTHSEISQIQQVVSGSSFEPGGSQKVTTMLAGQVWNGKTLQVGDIVGPGVWHYLKHVVVEKEWPTGTTYDQYIQSLKSVIANPTSGIFISKYNEYWHVGFVGESEIWQSENGFPYILVEYRVKYGYWVTGFQPEDLEKQLLKNREYFIWLRMLNSK